MSQITDTLPAVVYWATAGGWVLFGAIFVLRRRPPRAAERVRDPAAMVGLALQAAGFIPVWWLQRPRATSFAGAGPAVDVAIAVVALGLLAGSLALTLAAVRRLGKQWSIGARLVDDHELVTDGPYALVRHPIYTGMLGMLVVTGLAFSRWYFLLPGAALYWFGTELRTRVEEKLLRSVFPAYDEYARRVPALIPRPWTRGDRPSPRGRGAE